MTVRLQFEGDTSPRPRVVLVTDPMCSWCFGMTPEFERLMAEQADRLEFDFFLAGINTTTTQSIGDYGRRRIRRLWEEVTAVTGARFGDGLPAGDFIYNSSRACVAVHAMRRFVGAPPFDYLHAVQARFFREAVDIGLAGALIEEAAAHGVTREAMREALDDPELHALTRTEFAEACRYGTQALPNVLLDSGDGLRLLAGGYADADTLREQIRATLARA